MQSTGNAASSSLFLNSSGVYRYKPDMGWRPPTILPSQYGLTLCERDGLLPPVGQLPRPLGAGSQGICFVAKQKGVAELVAVKWLWPGNGGSQPTPILETVLREASLSCLPAHPNLVQVHGLLKPRKETRRYPSLPVGIVMELFDHTLGDIVHTARVDASDTMLKRDVAIRFARDIACGLQFLHNLGLVHCDLVPANIAIRVKSGEAGGSNGSLMTASAAVGDLSTLAVDLQRDRFFATPGNTEYVAPERNGGPPRKRWDVYSFGKIVSTLHTACGGGVDVLAALAETCTASAARRPSIDGIFHQLDTLQRRAGTSISIPVFDRKRQADNYLMQSTRHSVALTPPAIDDSLSNCVTFVVESYKQGLYRDVATLTDSLLSTGDLGLATSRVVLTLQAGALERTGQPIKALKSMRQAAKLDDSTPECATNLLLCLCAANELEEAKKLASGVEQRWPNDVHATLAAGLVFAKLNETHNALRLFDLSHAADPNSGEALHAESCVHSRTGDFKSALRSCRQAVKRTPTSPLYLNQMGVLLIQQALHDSADPPNGSVLKALGFFKKAVEHSRVQIAPDCHTYEFNCAVTLLMCGNAERAAAILLRLVESDDDARILATLGEAYLMMGRWKAAARTHRAALRRNKHDGVLWNNLAVALLQQGKTKSALNALRNACKSAASAGSAYLNTGLCLLELRDEKAALEALGEAESFGATSWQLHYLKSQALSGLQRYDDAVAHAESAVKAAPEALVPNEWLLCLYNTHLLPGFNDLVHSLTTVLSPLKHDPRAVRQCSEHFRSELADYSGIVAKMGSRRNADARVDVATLVRSRVASLSQCWSVRSFCRLVWDNVSSPDTLKNPAVIENWCNQVRSVMAGEVEAASHFVASLRWPDNDASSPGAEEPIASESGITRFAFSVFDDRDATEHAIEEACQKPNAALRWVRLRLLAAEANLARGFHELRAIHECKISKYEHQVRAVLHAMHMCGGRALLADDVGLGKTIEAGLVLKEYLARGEADTCLIVVPKPLVEQWHVEMKTKFSLEFSVFDKKWSAQKWTQERFVLASMSCLKRPEYQSLTAAKAWDMLIVDEAHHARRGRRTHTWRLLNRVRARYRLLLTATPIQNSVRDLHALINLAQPGLLGTFRDFSDRFVYAQDSRCRLLDDRNLPQLKRLLNTVMVRTRRDQSGIELPKRKVFRRGIDLARKERTLYEDVTGYIQHTLSTDHKANTRLSLYVLQRELSSSPMAAAATLGRMAERQLDPDRKDVLAGFASRCRRIKCWTKYQVLEDLVRSRDVEKTIVFTEFTATAEKVVERLRAAHINAVLLSASSRSVSAQIAQVRADAQVLVTTKLGGEGHNLQFAQIVVNFDFPWNPMRIEQRIGRVHRLEQTKTVNVFNLVTVGTIEEYVVNVLQEKLRLFEQVVGEVQALLGVVADKQSLEAAIQAIVSSGNLEAGFGALHKRIDTARAKYVDATLLRDRWCPSIVVE